MKNISKIFLLAILSLIANFSKGQIQANNTRYLSIVEVYPVKTATPDRIQTAKNLGCNAVNFTIDYRSVHGFNPIPNVWASYDSVMAKCKALDMKIGIRVLVDNSCLGSTLGNANDNFPQICDNINPQERMIGKLLNNAGELVHQQVSGPSPTNAPEWEQRVLLSLASQTQKNRIASFTNEILNRYKATYSNDILWMNVAYTSEQEGGFPYSTNKGNGGEVLFDYSQPMIQGFRTWLQTKYVNISALNANWARSYTSFSDPAIYPKTPSFSFKTAFEGNDGQDWWEYRTKVIRDATEIFAQAVRSHASQIRVITDYGSVYDVLSLRRGTYNFKEINTNMDGIKINDAPYYDHRFATDLTRSNLPNKFIANEVEWSAGQDDNAIRQFGECYSHGANWVNIFKFQELVDAGRGYALTNVANTYLNSPVSTIVPGQVATFNLSSMLAVEGCNFVPISPNAPYSEINNCDAYQNWKSKFNISNSPVNLVMVDDISDNPSPNPNIENGCNIAAPTGVSANPSSITTGGQSILNATCPIGTRAVWNSSSTTVSPTSTTTYQVKCVGTGNSSSGSNIINISATGGQGGGNQGLASFVNILKTIPVETQNNKFSPNLFPIIGTTLTSYDGTRQVPKVLGMWHVSTQNFHTANAKRPYNYGIGFYTDHIPDSNLQGFDTECVDWIRPFNPNTGQPWVNGITTNCGTTSIYDFVSAIPFHYRGIGEAGVSGAGLPNGNAVAWQGFSNEQMYDLGVSYAASMTRILFMI